MNKKNEIKAAKAKRAKILKLRKKHTLKELAEMFGGVSTARISQQLKQAEKEAVKLKGIDHAS